ncbi:hypothetical protein HAX54_048644, partial [Datura stramonium]|nr:hypothetical protein [Datura stramonium]
MQTKARRQQPQERGSKGLEKELHQVPLFQRHPLLRGLELRIWRSMDSNGSILKKNPNMPWRIELMKAVWHLNSPPFVTPSVSCICLLIQRSATSPHRGSFMSIGAPLMESAQSSRGQVVSFTARSFNAFLGTLVVDPKMYFLLLEKDPYHDIRYILCEDHSASRWDRCET